MKLEFRESFSKDIDKIKDKAVKASALNLIEKARVVNQLSDLPNVKKLKGGNHFYRIRVGDYRIGIEYKNSTIIFRRFLLRKDIYKYFP
jgi:mRNA interferase RelE/StbE